MSLFVGLGCLMGGFSHFCLSCNLQVVLYWCLGYCLRFFGFACLFVCLW